MQTRYMERSNSISREKRALDPIASEEGRREQKRPALASVIVEALKVDSLQKLCSSLEPVLRRVVSEEVERALAKLGPAKVSGRDVQGFSKQIKGPDGRNLQFRFRSRLSLPLFTGGKVEGEQGATIHIVLLDANTGHVVTSGPESSVKLDVVVLEGDFNDEEGWSPEEFDSHIVKERDGKRPLLSGDLQVTLKDGVGTLGELSFTDNSSWIRSRKFRLGLKVASGCCEGIRIHEAKTDAFTVKDHRGELYKKHYPPALHDEVWRLEKIGKDGSFHKRLNKAGIYTVEDFLRLVVRDSQRLRNILGSGMSNKMWDALVEHAKTCVLSGKLYVYYPDDVRNVGVVFNNIYELSGLIAGGQYCPADSLSDSEKVYVDTLVKKAYDNWMHVIEYDGKSLLGFQQNTDSAASQNDVTMGSHNYSSSFNPQPTLLSLPASISSEQPSISPGLSMEGHDASVNSQYPMHSENVNFTAPIQFDGTSFPLHNQMFNASQQAQPPRSENVLSVGPPQSSASGFQNGGTSNFTSYRGLGDFFPEEEIRMRSHEMLENEDMQHLLRMFNSGGHGHTPFSSVSGEAYPHSSASVPNQSSNYAFNDDRTAFIGQSRNWVAEAQGSPQMGIFIRKQAAERRAQLVELDDL